MKSSQKFVILTFAFIAPCLAVMLFLIPRYPPDHVPEWIPLSGACYILATILFMGFFGKRIIVRGTAGAPAQPPSAPARRTVAAGMLFIAYLVAIWSGFFVYGTFEFLRGEIPAKRALPAGALLLAFILVLIKNHKSQ